MNLWIDDLRDPKGYLNEEELKNVIWKNEAWNARKTLFQDLKDEIEILYLDNFLGDKTITGEKILGMLSFKLKRFPNLKVVNLHSSDHSVVKRLLDQYTEKFKEHNIVLKKSDYHTY